MTNWEVYNPNNNNAFTIENTTGYSGNQCAKLVNFGQAPSNIDELISSPIDLSVIPANGTVTLSFRYSYRKKLAADYEYLKVFITGDCGNNWVQRKTLGGNQLSSIALATGWKPSSQADWVTIHMTNVTSNYFEQNFRVKFKFEGEGGNNFYLDDINLYSGAPSNTLVLGLEEQTIEGMVVYPNPAQDEISVKYNTLTAGTYQVSIVDMAGKTVQNHTIQSASGENVVLMDIYSLSSGKYNIKIQGAEGFTTVPFVKK